MAVLNFRKPPLQAKCSSVCGQESTAAGSNMASSFFNKKGDKSPLCTHWPSKRSMLTRIEKERKIPRVQSKSNAARLTKYLNFFTLPRPSLIAMQDSEWNMEVTWHDFHEGKELIHSVIQGGRKSVHRLPKCIIYRNNWRPSWHLTSGPNLCCSPVFCIT